MFDPRDKNKIKDAKLPGYWASCKIKGKQNSRKHTSD